MSNLKKNKIEILDLDITDLKKEIGDFLSGNSKIKVVSLDLSNLIEEKEIIKNMKGEVLEATYEVNKPYFCSKKIEEIKKDKKCNFYALISYSGIYYGELFGEKNYIELHKIEK